MTDPHSRDERRSEKILLTGATGRIGRVVLEDLLSRGYSVRAVTSKTPPQTGTAGNNIEWRQFDLLTDDAYDELVSGCAAVVHLAAELGNIENMQRANADATRLLAKAAEQAGVKAFCYTSSIAVYGSSLRTHMSEDAPVLTFDRDVRAEYWAPDTMRAYGRTKLAGEFALRQVAHATRYVVLRPTVVVDVSDLIGIRDWSMPRRMLAAHRHAHHVYVRDVSDAIIWSMDRALAGTGMLGSIEVFNLSEDDYPEPTYGSFMRKAYTETRDPRFNVVTAPTLADWSQHVLKFRMLPVRNPLWGMRFPNDRLRNAGYRFRFGLSHLEKLALERLSSEAKGPPQR